MEPGPRHVALSPNGGFVYVINEMFGVCRRLSTPPVLAAGLLLGFLASFATDLFLTFAGA